MHMSLRLMRYVTYNEGFTILRTIGTIFSALYSPTLAWVDGCSGECRGDSR
jgi:hypothetical protein